MNRKGLLKDNWHYILLLLILSIITLVNIHPNQYVLGLDNISPYFGTEFIADKVFSSNSFLFISYWPLLLISPLFDVLHSLSISYEAIIQGYLFLSLFIGVFGAGKLSQVFNKDSKGQSIYLLGSIFYLTTLLTYWIFNQPNLFFVAAYASIPWLIVLFIQIHDRSFNMKSVLFYLFIIILFLQTSINLVAFVTYLFSTVLLTGIFLYIRDFKVDLKRLFIVLIFSLILWFGIMQILLMFAPNRLFIGNVISDHVTELRGNPNTEEISTSLTDSGLLRGDLVNSIRFAGNWFEIHDSENIPLFQGYSQYNSVYMVLVGLLPFFLILSGPYLQKEKKDRKRSIIMSIIIIIGVLITSKYLLLLIANIPLLSDAFRWNASKFWPLYIVPLAIFSSYSHRSITDRLKPLSKGVIIVFIIVIQLIYIYPIFQGELFSTRLVNNIPEEYFEIDGYLEESDKLIYLPLPSRLYFYDYDWGYFGSTFITYMTKGDDVDTGILDYFYHTESYKDISNSLEDCNKLEIQKIMGEEELTGIIFDKSLNIDNSVNEMELCLNGSFSNVEKISEDLILYR